MASPTATGGGAITSALGSVAPPILTPSPTKSATSSAASSSSRAGPQVYTVKVGAGGFKYDPPQLNASVGDTITFEFYPPDHSVARADFQSPCVPYEYTGPNRVGFWSDTQNVSTVNDLTHWNLTINSTEPIFYYCAAPGSCLDHQMVGVINPNDTETLDMQIQAAKEAKLMVKPGDPIPAEASSTLHPTGTPTGAVAGGSSGSTSHGTHLSGGAIAGIVVGAVAFLVICAALFFYVGRTKSLKEMVKRNEATVPKSTGGPEAGHAHYSTQAPPPGFAPFSPQHAHTPSNEYGGQLPAYGQHNATDAYPSGWASPQQHPGHMSMGTPPPQMAEVKPEMYQNAPVEMHSPTPGQQTFTHELEAPIKAPR